MSLTQAAEHVHMDASELKHFAQRGEIEAEKRGDDWYFEHRTLDEWAQRNLLTVGKRDLERVQRADLTLENLFRADAIDLDLGAKAKAGVIRDMSELAVKSGLVYDTDGLYAELAAREEAASTAIGNGVALLHPRYHDPYFFEESFIAYGRSSRGVFFGAPDDEPTHHFFLICSTNHEEHLHLLAKLALLARKSEFLEALASAENFEDILKACQL